MLNVNLLTAAGGFLRSNRFSGKVRNISTDTHPNIGYVEQEAAHT